ncbi:hypothetical protein D3C73_1389570 [compost metagenome]
MHLLLLIGNIASLVEILIPNLYQTELKQAVMDRKQKEAIHSNNERTAAFLTFRISTFETAPFLFSCAILLTSKPQSYESV